MLAPAAVAIEPSCRREVRPDESAVSLRGVSKAYRRGSSETQVLNSVDLQVRRGECLFLLGPSGSGKTTLMSIIGCVLTADRGTINILGQNPTRLSGQELASLRRDQIGFVFQRFHLIRGLSALENVCVPLTLAGWRRFSAEARGRELLEQVGLLDKARVEPRRLSVGQCQRIAIARALAADPPLVLADEPTAALDADSGRAAMDLLRRLTVARGKTAIVVTHDHRILPYADRVVRVERGELHEEPKDSRPPRSGRTCEPPGEAMSATEPREAPVAPTSPASKGHDGGERPAAGSSAKSPQ